LVLSLFFNFPIRSFIISDIRNPVFQVLAALDVKITAAKKRMTDALRISHVRLSLSIDLFSFSLYRFLFYRFFSFFLSVFPVSIDMLCVGSECTNVGRHECGRRAAPIRLVCVVGCATIRRTTRCIVALKRSPRFFIDSEQFIVLIAKRSVLKKCCRHDIIFRIKIFVKPNAHDKEKRTAIYAAYPARHTVSL
jgi:hypothetical protein